MTLPAADPLTSGGGGGGGGITAEADQLVLYDDGTDTYFLRRYVKDDTGGGVSIVDTELDGTTAYAVSAEANVVQAPIQPTGGPNVVYTADRYLVGDSPVVIPAGALEVKYVVLADDVSWNGVAIPAGERVAHGIDGTTTGAMTFTITGSGEVLVIEERAA